MSMPSAKQIAKAIDVPLNEFFPPEKLMVSETQAAYGKISDDEQLLLQLI